MSNHLHAMISSPSDALARFMRYIKGEISYRWSRQINWSESLWSTGYLATALPTHQSQENCLKYILSQGVKEGFVAKAHQWPGVHCAKTLASGAPLKGHWFNATDWRRKLNTQAYCKHPKPVKKTDFYRNYTLGFEPIPAWADIDEQQRRMKIRQMLDDIEQEGRENRRGKRPLGAKNVQKAARYKPHPMPKLPWHENRRRMICWAAKKAKETVEYLMRYWSFQRAFRRASNAFCKGDLAAEFPLGAFRPRTICTEAPG